MSNPFVYTDRDFASFRNQMTEFVKARIPDWSADPSDFAYSIIEAMAYLGDMMSYYVDRAAMESNILTAQVRSNVFNYARIFGYSPGLAQSAACSVTLTNTGADAVVIASGTKVGSHAGGQAYEIREEVRLEPTGTAGDSVTVTALEGESKYVELGVSNGIAHQSFAVSDYSIDGRRDALYVVTWNPLDPTDKIFWNYTEMLLDVASNEFAFTVYLNDDGTAEIMFGDGVAGSIPTSGWNVGLYYRTCHGSDGNAPGATINRFLVSWDDPAMASYAAVEVAGDSPDFGRDAEDVEQVRNGALNLIQAQRRAVTAHDYESLARSDSRVLDAFCESLVWSRPNVWICPRSESDLTDAQLSTELRAMLQQLAIAGVNPSVQTGTPRYFRATVKILIPSTVDEEYVTKRVQDAIYERLQYSKSVFHEGVAPDHLIRAVHLSIPSTLVQYIQVLGMEETADWRAMLGGTTATWKSVTIAPPLIKPKSSEFVVLHRPEHITVQVEKVVATGKSRF